MNYQLYLVTDRYNFSDTEFLKKVEQACKAGVTILQLREKNITTRNYYELALKVKVITDYYHIPLIIDDRIDICLAVDAVGVHIGNDEIPVKIARKIIGPNKIIGVSAKNVNTAQNALKDGANYLGVGAIYPTKTKVITQPTSFETLTEIINAVNIPVVAIGGINETRIQSFKKVDIAGVAMVSEIMKAPDIYNKVTSIKTKLKEVLP